MPVRLGAFGAAAWSAAVAASFCLMCVTGAAAQSLPALPAASGGPKPVTGFVPTFEIMRTVRAAGFDPLAPPLREGTTYVLRATDYRGILMRVVLDARTGAIRDVTRIVPAASGSLGVVLPPYGPPAYASPYGEPPYGAPAEYEGGPPMLRGAEPAGARPALPLQPLAAPPLTHAKTSTRKSSLPLPRPRPAGLASSQPPAAPLKNEKGAGGAPAPSPAGAIGNASPAAATPAPPALSPPAAQAKSPAAVPLSD